MEKRTPSPETLRPPHAAHFRKSPRKVPFRIEVALERIREAIAPYPKAMLFRLFEEGRHEIFEQVLACLISIRTRDEISLSAARRLLAKAKTPKAILDLPVKKIDALIAPATLHHQKAYRIKEIARQTLARFAGKLPCDESALASLPGIGPKCANLTVGIACGKSRVGVDIHVFRVTRRWGFIRADTPLEAVAELEGKLPEDWIELNSLLVPFGKHICTDALPKCSICPVLEMCRQVGVTRHR